MDKMERTTYYDIFMHMEFILRYSERGERKVASGNYLLLIRRGDFQRLKVTFCVTL